VLGASALCLAFGQGAQAGPLASASLTIEIAGATLIFPGAGPTGTATSATSATLGASSVFAGTSTIILTGTVATKSPVDKIQVVVAGNAAGLFTGATPNQVGGGALLTGAAALYATPAATSPFLLVPIKAGSLTHYTVMGCGLSFSVWGAPWTAGVATLPGFFGTRR
jgi:hypothetical protein